MLREKAQASDLMQEARLEGNQLIRIMDFIVRSAGWSLFIQSPDSNLPLPADSLLT